MLTISDLLDEMRSWVAVGPSLVEQAVNSNINVKNNKRFARLVEDWVNGVYDEDPQIVVSEISSLL